MIRVSELKKRIDSVEETPGIYIFYSSRKEPIYVGKAKNLRRRLLSYLDNVGKASQILKDACFLEIQPTESEVEALLLEADLIKQFRPKFNVKHKDDKSFLYLVIRNDTFPYVEVVREKTLNLRAGDEVFGPFVDGSSLKEIIKALRKVFPFRDCKPLQFKEAKKTKRACLYYHLDKCLGPCIKQVSAGDYREMIRDLILFLQRKKERLLSKWQKAMERLAQKQEFEKAKVFRDKIKAVERLQRLKFISEVPVKTKQEIRIEAFDVAQLGGDLQAGAMVVFKGQIDENNLLSGQFAKDDFRRFKLKTARDDLGLLQEMLKRRFKHSEWPLPQLILVDGNENQLRVAKAILSDFGLEIPVVAITKDKHHRALKPVLPFDRFKWPYLADLVRKNWSLLVEINERAHRFSQNYFRILHRKRFKGT